MPLATLDIQSVVRVIVITMVQKVAYVKWEVGSAHVNLSMLAGTVTCVPLVTMDFPIAFVSVF